MAGAESGLDPVIPFVHQPGIIGKSFRFQRVVKTLPALLRVAYLERTADESNAPPASARQVAYGFVSAMIVIGDDGVVRERGIRAHGENKGDIDLSDHLAHGRPEVSRCFSEKDSVDALRKEELDGALFFVENVVAIAEEQIVAVLDFVAQSLKASGPPRDSAPVDAHSL